MRMKRKRLIRLLAKEETPLHCLHSNVYLAYSKTISQHVLSVAFPLLPHVAQSSLNYISMSRLHRPESSRADTGGPKKIFTVMGITSDFEVTIFSRVNSVEPTILCQIHAIKKSVYHTGTNYHFYSNVNYIYYQS